MPNQLLIISGSYGSGKTEYATNLALDFQKKGQASVLVDLDVVNPYFRSRDVREAFESRGIEVVAPEGSYTHADLPMLSPRVAGAIGRKDRTVILDVGGDPMGARILGRFQKEIQARGFEFELVVNTRRPETRDPAGVMEMMDKIQAKARIPFTHLAANSHLMEETDHQVVAEGLATAREVAKARDLTVRRVLVLEDCLDRVRIEELDSEVLVLKKFMKTPWQQRQTRVHQRI